MSNDTAALAALTARMVAWTPSSGSTSTQRAHEPAPENTTTDDHMEPAAMETARTPSPAAKTDSRASKPPSQAPIPAVPDDAMETDGPEPVLAPSPADASTPPVIPEADVDVDMDGALAHETTSPAPDAAHEDAEEELEYELETILDSKRIRGKVKYLIKWAGYDEESWEPVDSLVGAEEALADFHARHPCKPNHASAPSVPAVEEAEYEVEEIVDSKLVRGKVKYLVQWAAGDQTWEPVANLETAEEAIAHFHRKHPRKPKPAPAAEEAEYEVEEIVDSKRVRGKVKYLVQWAAGDQTWEAVENLAGAEDSLAAFHAKAKHPRKPKSAPAAEEDEYEVEGILDSKLVRKKVQYLVKWAGSDETTWEPVANLVGAEEAVNAFHRKHPRKPGHDGVTQAKPEDSVYEVEEIRDSKRVGKTVKYLVKWAGYNEETWEPVGNLDAAKALNTFHSRHPNKPRAAGVAKALQPSRTSNLRAPQFGKINGIAHDVEERLLGALQRYSAKYSYWDKGDEATLDGLATKVAQSYGHKGNYNTANLLKVAKRHADVIKP